MEIRNIEGPGVKVARGNVCKVIGCNVSMSKCGVEAISCQPLIAMNHFFKNYEDGIVTKAKNDLRCDAQIRFNTIERNKANGILCTGKFNCTRIEKNLMIEKNKMAGIKTTDFASITICNNCVQSNYG